MSPVGFMEEAEVKRFENLKVGVRTLRTVSWHPQIQGAEFSCNTFMVALG